MTHPQPLVEVPDERLYLPSKPVNDLPSPRVQAIVDQLIATVKEKGGAAGLAAPQIGIHECVIVCSFDRTIESLQPMINPIYTPLEVDVESFWEMCFSAPQVAANVARYKKITLTYQDLQGETHTRLLEGFAARVIQHECDHLKGILCVDKGSSLKTFQTSKERQDFLNWIRQQQGHSFPDNNREKSLTETDTQGHN